MSLLPVSSASSLSLSLRDAIKKHENKVKLLQNRVSQSLSLSLSFSSATTNGAEDTLYTVWGGWGGQDRTGQRITRKKMDDVVLE